MGIGGTLRRVRGEREVDGGGLREEGRRCQQS